MIIIGIDPGLATVGFGVVQAEENWRALDHGLIKTPAEMPLETRLKAIFQGVGDLIKKHSPQLMVVERLFFAKNSKTAMLVGKAAGVIALAGALAEIPVKEFTPLQIKDALCGYGRAKKPQVGFMVKEMLGVDKVKVDAGDALACVLCYLVRRDNGMLDEELELAEV